MPSTNVVSISKSKPRTEVPCFSMAFTPSGRRNGFTSLNISNYNDYQTSTHLNAGSSDTDLLIEFQEEDFITIQGILDISTNTIKPISLNPNITTSGQKITLVNIPKEYYNKDVNIYNSSGKLLKKIKVEANNNASQIISSQLDSGVYIVKICKETLRLIIL